MDMMNQPHLLLQAHPDMTDPVGEKCYEINLERTVSHCLLYAPTVIEGEKKFKWLHIPTHKRMRCIFRKPSRFPPAFLLRILNLDSSVCVCVLRKIQ